MSDNQVVRVLFCRTSSLVSRLIRAATWSEWSHVAILDGDDVIEAMYPKVRVTNLVDLILREVTYEVVEFKVNDAKAIIDAVRSQVGKPYDLAALIGFPFRRDWQADDKWFCSELVSWAFSKGGSPLFRESALHRIVPQHLWMLNSTVLPH